MKRKPMWDLLTDKQKQDAINNLIGFVQDEWGEKIGVIAAEQLLDSVMESTFNAIYNKGVVDAQKTVEERVADLNVDLDTLLKK